MLLAWSVSLLEIVFDLGLRVRVLSFGLPDNKEYEAHDFGLHSNEELGASAAAGFATRT